LLAEYRKQQQWDSDDEAQRLAALEEAAEEDDARADKVPDNEFDAALKRLKKTRARKKRSVGERERHVRRFVGRMDQAADADDACFRKKQLALGKLKLVDTFVGEMEKNDLVGLYLENGVLGAVNRWLRPRKVDAKLVLPSLAGPSQVGFTCFFFFFFGRAGVRLPPWGAHFFS